MSRVDVVLFGASGFTGLHAVKQLVPIADQHGLTWAVAGRNQEKLRQLLKDVSEKLSRDLSSTKILIADVNNEQSVRDMCAQAKVVVNCCGPYTLYGEVVVRAAIHERTHYVDVSGEPNFIEMMQLKYDKAAREAGVYVVSACAFESIPADLGVVFLQQNFDGILNSVEFYLSPDMLTESVNYGTWHSLVYYLAQLGEVRAIRKKIYPTPLPKFTPKLKSRFPIHKRLDGWCMPLPGNDSSAVYRTQRYFYERDGTRPAHFKSYVRHDSLLTLLAVIFMSVFIYVMSQFKITRQMLLENPKIFSFGLITKAPSESIIKKMGFKMTLFGKGWDKSDADNINNLPPTKSVIANVSGVNPGYGMTVLGVLYSAVAILKEQQKMPHGGGVLTPGIAFAKTNLVKNLQDNNVAFEVLERKVHGD